MTALPVPRSTPDGEHRFFVFDAHDGDHYYFKTAAERDQYAEHVISGYLDDGWDDTVQQVVAGELTHTCVQVDRVERPDDRELDENGCDDEGRYWEPEWDYSCNYALQPLEGVPLGGAAQRLVAAGTLAAAVALYKDVLSAHLDQLAAGTLGSAAYAVLRLEWERALLQTTRGLSRDPVALGAED